ncbi:MAG: hypothetical protein AB7I27_01325 [Bacteriovoracaceae bacterium]
MIMLYLLFFLPLSVFSAENPKIQLIPTTETSENYEHQHKGCPENSECDQVMGIQLERWKTLISKVRENKIEPSKKAALIELFRAKYGIPVEFYTNKKSQQGLKPLFFNSPCREHNPKSGDKVLRGTAFIKSMNKDKAIVWRDQTQIEVPTSDLLIPQPVTVYFPERNAEFVLPLNDQPLLIKNKELLVLREEDGLFYMLKVSENGDWKVENWDFSHLSTWENKKETVKCPQDKVKKTSKIFEVEFCKTIWDEDLKKTVIVKLHQGCSI